MIYNDYYEIDKDLSSLLFINGYRRLLSLFVYNLYVTFIGSGNGKEDCVGNCFDPQPMGRTENYEPDFTISESPLTCRSNEGECWCNGQVNS